MEESYNGKLKENGMAGCRNIQAAELLWRILDVSRETLYFRNLPYQKISIRLFVCLLFWLHASRRLSVSRMQLFLFYALGKLPAVCNTSSIAFSVQCCICSSYAFCLAGISAVTFW